MHNAASVERVQSPAWVWILVALAAFGLYLMTMDNGAVLQGFAEQAHEFFHDGRHFLGVPCH